jgi:hypothetical protein
LAGIVVNRLGRTRDARYWHAQLVDTYADGVLGTISQRAAVAEASAQSLPVHGLGNRAGGAEAAAEFDALLASLRLDAGSGARSGQSEGREGVVTGG